MKTVKELQAAAGANLGLRWNILADLSPENRERLYDEMADLVFAAPRDYPDNVVEWAVARRGGTWYREDIDTYGPIDAVTDFGGEVLTQAARINDTINPFSEGNLSKVSGALLITVLVGGLLYFVGPPLIAAFRK